MNTNNPNRSALFQMLVSKLRVRSVLEIGLGVIVLTAGLAQGHRVDDVSGLAQSGVDLVRAYERELLADAAGRVSFADPDVWAGCDSTGAFFVGDGDANKLTLGGATQFRYVMNFADEPPAGSEDFTSGFEFRRTRLWAAGSIWSKDFTYKVMGEAARNGGDFTLLEASGAYKFDSNWSAKFGQYILGLLREESTSPFLLQTLDRSIVNNTFAPGYSEAVEMVYTAQWFRARGAFSDGLRTAGTEFTSSVEADYALTLRAEARWGGGEWKRFNDISSFRGESLASGVAGAVHYQSGGETGGTTDRDVLTYVADVVTEGSGWSVWGEFIGRRTEDATTEFDDFGAILQAGIFAADQIELFGRFDALFPDSERSGGSDDFYMGTLGATYFVSPMSHAFKITGEVNATFTDVTSSASLIPASNVVNLLPDSGDNQIIIRIGAQILF